MTKSTNSKRIGDLEYTITWCSYSYFQLSAIFAE